MFNRNVLLIILLLVTIFCSGCFGSTEPDQLSYIAAIGIDKADKEGMYNFSYQIDISKGSVSAGESGGGKGGGNAGLIVIQAPSLAEARNLLNSFLSFRVTLTHIKALVISDEVAREGIGRVFSPIMRFREYRGTMYVFVSQGSARKFMEAFNPLLKLAPSKYYEWVMATQEGSGYYLDTSLHQFYKRLKSISAQPYTTLVGVGNKELEQEPANGPTAADKSFGYIAGESPHSGQNPLEFVGTAVFDGDKMVGTLSTIETRLLSYLLGHPTTGYLVVQDPLLSQDAINIRVRPGAAPEINGEFKDGIPSFQVKLEVEGEITGISSGINYETEEYLTLLENQMKLTLEEEIVNFIKKTQTMDSDIVGFGYYMRPNFKLEKDFREYNWHQHYREATFAVEVKAKIRRTGLMIRTLPVSE